MTSVVNSLDNVALEDLTLYHTSDPVLSSVLVFYGPVVTANSTVSSSRIQAYIVSPCGVKSYPRITVSPTAPIYAPVHYLPRDQQGDPERRGLAVCLYKYLSEISDPVRHEMLILAKSSSIQLPRPIKPFEEAHAAELAHKMVVIEDAAGITRSVKDAFRDRTVPWIDAHLVLPPQSITLPDDSGDTTCYEDYFAMRYGEYAELVTSLGDPIFLPTSRLKRAPSTPKNSNKSKLFKTNQKEALRLSMCEVVDTEERYVGKLYELSGIIHEFKAKAATQSADSASLDEKMLMKLFPQCLEDILAVNMRFLDEIRQVLEVTERDALDDISSDTILDASTFKKGMSGRRIDPMGIIPFARALLAWFPKFSDSYKDYMRSHQDVNQIINMFMADPYSSFSKTVLETGEKRVRSLLMEPVQRLPRYSLLIDSMTNALPSMHPATRTLLKARDIITDICSLEVESTLDNKQKLRRLQTIVPTFPHDMLPSGRLISAVDAYDLASPFQLASPENKSSILLLYADMIVVLARPEGTEIKARSLLAYLDKQNPTDSENERPTEVLAFAYALPVHELQSSQSADGQIVYVTLPEVPTRAFELATTYEGKAGKFIEEITKAKVEDQFPESFRENGKWSLHHIKSSDKKLGCFLSLFEEDPMLQERPSSIRIIFEGTSPIERHPDIDLSGVVTCIDRERYKLDLVSISGQASTDIFAPNELAVILANRLQTYARSLYQPDSPRSTTSLVNTNYLMLRAITKHLLEPPKSLKRPKSPSKLLSGIWGGSSSKDQSNDPKSPVAENVSASAMDVPSISPGLTPQTDTPRSLTPKHFTKTNASFSSLSKLRPDSQQDPLLALEQTFTAYIICLRSRRGNIVGRILLSRKQADPVEVNELYNILIEDASKIQAAAEVPVDVLFVSFEMFMASIWNETVGPVISSDALKDMLAKFDSMFPGHFEQYFHRFLKELVPVNRKALAAIVRLLAELLDASGNDGDRGVLTAAFAELLAQDCDPQQCIPLLDRFVEDYDNLFDSVDTVAPFEGPYIPDTSWVPGHRPAGSVGSNSSTFRKRFGFGHSKDPSKMGQTDSRELKELREKDKKEFKEIKEGKVSSIIRSLSKGKGLKDEEHGLYSKNSFSSKSSLFRSKSTNTDTDDSRLGNILKPLSKDRTPVQAVFSPPPPDESAMRPHSSHANFTLDSIGEEPPSGPSRPGVKPKKKRRSSLSDLSPIPSQSPVTPNLSMFENPVSTPSSSTQNRMSLAGPPSGSLYSRPNSEISGLGRSSPMPSRLQRPLSVRDMGSPSRSFIPTHQRTNPKKENVSLSPTRSLGRTNAIPPLSPRKKLDMKSSIPTLSPKNAPDPLKWKPKDTSAPPSPTRLTRLRMQNPQKLRERLQTDRNAFEASEISLQEDIASIADEIRASSPTRTRSKPGSSTPLPLQAHPLLNRVCSLEAKVSAMTTDFQARANHLEKDIQMSLLVSERRSKQLDALYREASAENSALYDKFNQELNRMAKEMRVGNGESALRAQLQETIDELERTKKENMRLKREIGGLRAQQGGFPDL